MRSSTGGPLSAGSSGSLVVSADVQPTSARARTTPTTPLRPRRLIPASVPRTWSRARRLRVQEAVRTTCNSVDTAGQRVDSDCSSRFDAREDIRVSALPRPDLPPGPHLDLVTALHDLHHRAGWPSLRTLARSTGVSHTTVSKAFSHASLPSWGTLELLVETMGGARADFHPLWLSATIPATAPTSVTSLIAGRTNELATVRRHLESGTALLVITGEAGVGKTTLVSAAVVSAEVFVAVGHCVPLSTEVPLLPIVEALRVIHTSDAGQWFTQALDGCPAYVRTSLSRLLPELDAGQETPAPDDQWGLERLFTSIEMALVALASTRPLALHLEDCHWADHSTLDFLTHMTRRPPGIPVIATWRSDDPDVPEDHSRWLSRARWSEGTATIDLAPLTLAETARQLQLLLGTDLDDDFVGRIHARGQGLPLYTAQLARASTESELPRHLADLLDRRLGDIGESGWSVVRLLGVAQGSLAHGIVLRACGLEAAELDHTLRMLSERHLLRRTHGDDVDLAHPLFVEAIARRLLPGEAALVHTRLAEILATGAHTDPGVLAGHWRAAGRTDLEVAPRVAAMHQAGARFAYRDQLDAGSRVIELWDSGHAAKGIELWEVLVTALNASGLVDDWETGRPLLDRALALDLPDHARAKVAHHASQFMIHEARYAEGLDYLDEAITMLDQLPPSPDLVEALWVRIAIFVQTCRFTEAQADVRRALAALVARDDPRQRRRVLNWSAWLTSCTGDHDEALSEARRAQEIVLTEPDPLAEVFMAVNITDILLHAAAPAAQVQAAARDALREVDRLNLDYNYLNVMLRGNVARAHLNAGDTRAARACLEPVTASDASTTSASAHLDLAAVELREGRVTEALERCHAAEPPQHRHDSNWTEGVPLQVDIELWAGRSDTALALLEEALPMAMAGEASRLAAPLVRVAARACADDLDRTKADVEERTSVGARLHRAVAEAAVDPFGPDVRDATAPALFLSWRAEVDRIEDRESVEAWSRAAAAWDRFGCPHDAAYCRWRGAQVALRGGRGTTASRLLAQAATDAREHVPLSQAIAETARTSA